MTKYAKTQWLTVQKSHQCMVAQYVDNDESSRNFASSQYIVVAINTGGRKVVRVRTRKGANAVDMR